MVAVQVARDMLLSDEQNVWLIVNGAFITQRYLFSFADQNFAYFTSPITYSFIHGGYGHLAVNSLWLAAFGAVVARRLGVVRFTVFWALSALASVAFFAALNWGQAIPVVGASGVVSALMGAAARFAFPLGGRFNREKAHFLPRQSFSDVLQNRTVLVYLGFWFVISLLPAIGVGGNVNIDRGRIIALGTVLAGWFRRRAVYRAPDGQADGNRHVTGVPHDA